MVEKATKIFHSRQIATWGLALFLIALTARILYLVKFRENPFFNYYPHGFDQQLILKSTIEIARGNVWGPWSSEKQSAIYKYVLAFPLALFGENFYAVWIWQFLIGAFTAVLIYLIGQKIFGIIAGIIAGLWYSLYGPAIFFEGQALRESLYCFLLVLLTHLTTKVEYEKGLPPEKKKINWHIFASISIIASFAMQTRPTGLILFFGVLLYLWFIGLKDFQRQDKIKIISFMKIFFILVSSPLLIRSILMHGKFVFYDQSGPFVFLLSNLPDYSGVGWNPSPIYHAFIEKAGGENAITWSDTITRITELWTLFPLSVVTLYLKKVYFFFNGYEYPSNLNYYLFAGYSPLFRMFWSNLSVLSSFGFCGIILTLKNKEIKHKSAGLYFLFTGLFLSNVIFYPVDRFRLFHAPFLMLFASYALVKIISYLKERQIKALMASIIFVSVMIWFLKISSNFDSLIRPEDYRNLGRTYVENKSRQNIKKGEYFLYKAWQEWSKKGLTKNPAGEELGKIELYLAHEKIKIGDYQGGLCNLKIAELVWGTEEVKKIYSSLAKDEINLAEISTSKCLETLNHPPQ